MAVNSSSSSNDSLLHANDTLGMHCHFTKQSTTILTVYSITNVLLFVPLYVFVLYLGFQRWWQQRSSSSSAVMSHTDSFTYHLTSIELIGVLGFIAFCCAVYLKQDLVLKLGFFLRSFNWYGQMFFHMLTCVERYLAVVHPVTYLGLRRERGIRIRTVSIGCVWLLCFVESILELSLDFKWFHFGFLIFSVAIISFCSLSVLCILIRPGPGEQGADWERVDQSKQRAFYTILAILGVLVIKCVAGLIWVLVKLFSTTNECVLTAVTSSFNIPSSLVLPLLFLTRAGKLTCSRNNTQ